MDEPEGDVSEGAWPAPYDPNRAAPIRAVLQDVLQASLDFTKAYS
jgi:N-formylglutamate deformylase